MHMGARGPLKTVSHLRPVAGATEGTAAAAVQPMSPAKPEDVEIDPELDQAWDQIVPELDRAGLVSVADSAAIELCLRHFVMARQAYRQVDGEIIVTDHNHGDVKKNPAETVFRAESEMFLKFAQQLGMTFVSRARTPMGKAGDGGESNPFGATGS